MGQLLPDMEFRRFGEVKKENDFGQRADRLKTYYNKASGLYYKHITSVNDDSSVVNQFEASLTGEARVVIYNRHMFKVQAKGLVLGLWPDLQ